MSRDQTAEDDAPNEGGAGGGDSAAARGRKGAKGKGAAKKDAKKPAAGRDEADMFIAEVTEELQRDRAYTAFRRYGPFVGAAVVLIVIAAAVNEYLSAAATERARAAGAAIFDAVEAEDVEGSIATLTSQAERLEPGAAMVARLNAAALAAQNGDRAAAADLYDAVADAAEPGSPYVDLGRLRAAMMRFDDAAAEDSILAFEPLAEEGRPFRALALEMLGAAHVKAGDLAAARGAFRDAYEDPLAPQSLRARAADLLVGAGGADPRRPGGLEGLGDFEAPRGDQTEGG